MKARYKILNADRTVYNVGTVEGSWFTLEEARARVDYSKGQMIYECDGVNMLWEVL